MKYSASIYKYTFVLDRSKKYIGQSRCPEQRHKQFLNLSHPYAGRKLEEFRQEFGPEMFDYEILTTIEAETLDILQDRVNTLERYYIEKENSIEKGLNTSEGGGKYYRNVATIIEKLPETEIPEGKDDDSIEIARVKKDRIGSNGSIVCSPELIKLSDIEKDKRDLVRESICTRKNNDEDSEYRYFLLSDWSKINVLRRYYFEYVVFGDSRCTPVIYYDRKTWEYDYYESISKAFFESHRYGYSSYSYQSIRNWCKSGVNGYMTMENFVKEYFKINYDIDFIS